MVLNLIEFRNTTVSPHWICMVTSRFTKFFYCESAIKYHPYPIRRHFTGPEALALDPPSRRAEKGATLQKVLSFQKICQKRKMVIKIEFTPLSCTLQTAKIVPLKRVLN